jgi:hypothetical protein
LGLREIKYGERTPPARRVKVARELLAAGRIYDALDLFLIAGDEEGIREISDRAVKEGLPVILLTLKRALRPAKPAEWSAAGAKAFAAGRWREAFRCYREAGDEEGLARVREKLPGYDLYTPQGK